MADAFVACAFFMPEVRSGTLPKAGSGTLPEMGSGTSEMGSGTLPETGAGTLSEAGPDPIGDCDISALALYSALFYNSWCW